MIRQFPETNDVNVKIFRSKLKIHCLKYFNVFENVFEKSNTIKKLINAPGMLHFAKGGCLFK